MNSIVFLCFILKLTHNSLYMHWHFLSLSITLYVCICMYVCVGEKLAAYLVMICSTFRNPQSPVKPCHIHTAFIYDVHTYIRTYIHSYMHTYIHTVQHIPACPVWPHRCSTNHRNNYKCLECIIRYRLIHTYIHTLRCNAHAT